MESIKRNKLFNPVVCKWMILFAMRSNKIAVLSKQKEYYRFYNDTNMKDLIANLYLEEVENIVRSNPFKNYENLEENLYYIKGKVNIKKTLLNITSTAYCTYDEFTSNNKLNIIIKYILYLLLLDKEINKNVKMKINNMYSYFNDIDLQEVCLSDIENIVMHNNQVHYEFILILSKFIIGSLSDSDYSNNKFIDIEAEWWWIYQEFIRNYFEYTKDNFGIFEVSNTQFTWKLKSINNSNENMIPKMRTDIEIDTDNQHLIIDAKCYENSTSIHFNKEIFNADNMYQLKAYLDSYEYENKLNGRKLRGMLIYPYNEKNCYLNQKFLDIFKRYTIELINIDFTKSWDDTKKALNDLIKYEEYWFEE